MKMQLTVLSLLIGTLTCSSSAIAQDENYATPIVSSTALTKENQCEWGQWNSFKQHYIENGRVVDNSDPRSITTSEGQSYALFFALIANDKKTFDELLGWTELHLAGGDLTAQLPAWLWGTQLDGSQGILDSNSAADSDLWIAYSLLEAGRLWDNHYYQSLGHLLASRILREETIKVSGLGTVLLPGKVGFVLGKNHVRLNPSYVPLQLLTRMNTVFPNYQWSELYQSSARLLKETMPKGYSPDWVEWDKTQFKKDSKTQSVGSYNAIRVYLWAGMLPNSDPNKALLLGKMKPLLRAIERNKGMPETINVLTGKGKNQGGVGMNAAILPLLSSLDSNTHVVEYEKKIQAELPKIQNDYYYNSVLTLFGLGWYQDLYAFNDDGSVTPKWVNVCQ
ncbi:cellulose synthase complex periplasmic endoglucanase BcsZ [Aliivibrio fischeri]|uniref:cellulose synthase complex periplasmic endoglucanase BcsZ n=1 Tax=Aliivibrio fischeri TaxID=668 RepID=UPI001EEC68C1|nr:cellulose synthase complex periplasmic endoglucanase BcsZ [Aliivibrio fischeri]MCE4935368.1 cellulase [Aliivibrio fischeri]